MKLSDSERELLISEMFTMSLINKDLAMDMNEEYQKTQQVGGKNNE